ncbi:MAG: fasciclin domain-containing protein [Cryomorphaceae bacterium]
MKKILRPFLILAAAVIGMQSQAQTTLDLITASPQHSTLEELVNLSPTTIGLYGAPGPITIFAPNNAAFDAIPSELLDYYTEEPSTFLQDILYYHVVSGSQSTANLTDGATFNTILAGQSISISNDGTTIMVNNSTINQPNISASNGRLHGLDAVLVPDVEDVFDFIAASPDHTILAAAIVAAELQDDLEALAPYTVFAPTDAAFNALPENLVDALLADPTGLLQDILLYHVAGTIAASGDLSDGQEIPTLNGETVVVGTSGGVTINGANVSGPDNRTLNGIVHVIDEILIPSDVPTVLDIVVNSEDHNTLEAAVIAAELDDDLSGGAALTVFAPTDAAFNLLPEGLVETLLLDPTGVLANVLLQHVVGSIEVSDDLVDGETLTTLLGQEVTISNDGTTISIDGAVVSVANIPAINGVVHVLDAVIIPADQTTVYDVIVESADHTTLEAAVDAAELDDELQDGTALTVFAPTDAAFDLLPAGLVDALLLDPTGTLAEILLNHVVDGIALSNSLTQDQAITTLFGEDVIVDLNGGVFINGAEVTVADIPTINGVVHVINAVLVPDGAPTVLDIVVNSPDHNTLENAVIAAGLDDDLTDGESLTVFAPTDAAFDLLPTNLVEALLQDPEGVLANILLQHVVGSAEYSADLNDMDVLTSLLSQDLNISDDGTTISVNGANVTVANLVGINGVVHVIDAVIIPDDQLNVYDAITNSPDHTTLLTAVDAAGLDAALQSESALTVFAPTDAAFEALPENFVAALLTDAEGVLTEILQYHVAGSINPSTTLSDGQLIETLFGEDVLVEDDGSITINGANVTVADIATINGVVHVIDVVLVPEGATTIVDIVIASEDHNTLEQAVIDAELVDALSGEAGSVTLFAPTDAAFALVDPDELQDILDDPTGLLQDVLLYHVIDGIVLEANVVSGNVPTLFGEDISIDASSGVIINGSATVIVTDLVGINGVVHVIDAVLIPTTLSVEEISSVESFSVFPNPANSVMNVELEMVTSERISIDFVNMLGQVVKSVDLGQRSTGLNREVIDIQDMADGFYLMNVTIGDDQLTHKLQVVR